MRPRRANPHYLNPRSPGVYVEPPTTTLGSRGGAHLPRWALSKFLALIPGTCPRRKDTLEAGEEFATRRVEQLAHTGCDVPQDVLDRVRQAAKKMGTALRDAVLNGTLVLILTAIGLTVGLFVARVRVYGWGALSWRYGLLFFPAVFLICVLAWYLAEGAGVVTLWWRLRSFPVEVATDRLAQIIWRLAAFPVPAMELEVRRAVLRTLESTARHLQSLSRQLRAGDPETDAWSRARFDEVAASMRGLKTWIITPKSDSLPNLQRHLEAELAKLVRGDWDALARRAPGAAVKVPVLRRIGELLRTVVLAGAPALVLAVTRWLNAPLPEEWEGFGFAGAILWGLYILLSGLDPRLKEKIDTFRDLLGIVRGQQKKGG